MNEEYQVSSPLESDMAEEEIATPLASETVTEATEIPIPEDKAEDPFLEEDLPNYEAMAAEDLRILQSRFAVCRQISHISQLQNPLRYAQLRDLGLSPEEAYLATNYARLSAYQKDNRSHLHSAIPKGAGGESMSAEALSQARDLFGNLSDGELLSLYRRATKGGR